MSRWSTLPGLTVASILSRPWLRKVERVPDRQRTRGRWNMVVNWQFSWG